MRAYDYWYGYTAAEIELMSIDQPLVSYKSRKKNDGKHTAEEINATMEEWERTHGSYELSGEKVSLSELFGHKDNNNKSE